MRISSLTLQSFFYFIFTLFSGSSCFDIGYNSIRIQNGGPNLKSAPLSRYRSKPLYQDMNGHSNIEIAPADKGNDLKSSKSTAFSQKTLISVVISFAALVITATIGGFRIDFDFSTLLERSLLKIESLGPLGYIYFALVRASLNISLSYLERLFLVY